MIATRVRSAVVLHLAIDAVNKHALAARVENSL